MLQPPFFLLYYQVLRLEGMSCRHVVSFGIYERLPIQNTYLSISSSFCHHNLLLPETDKGKLSKRGWLYLLSSDKINTIMV